MRCRFALRIYGYVVMPEHVHLLVSEPRRKLLADAIHYLKLSFAKGLGAGVFWQKRYYDRNVRSEREFKKNALYSSQSGEAGVDGGAGRMEVEQLSSLCVW